MAARLAALEQRTQPQQQSQQVQLDPQVQQLIDQAAERKLEETRTRERVQAFHDAGSEQYPDWQKRCQDLQAMGADAQIAALLVEMPDGHRIAGSLRDDPEALERIALIKGERGRAIALGQFAAKIEAEPTRHASRAPRPPAPLPAGRSAATPNPYLMQSTDDLVRYFRAQETQKRT